jgi:hypothetical protein
MRPSHPYARVSPEQRRRAELCFNLLCVALVGGAAASTVAIGLVVAERMGWLDILGGWLT